MTPEQDAEIAALRANPQPTRRVTAPGMEAHLYKAIPVLDHGFVRVVDYMGDDAAICQAARVSYGRGTKSVSGDEGLIRYLMRHQHSTPFEMCEVKLHVKLPIFVARQWVRHRTANVNEYSGRYSILDREFYIPEPEALAAQSTLNHQGRGEALGADEAARVLDWLKADAARAYDHYEAMISTEGQQGLARELARMNLPANIYTQWYWKTDLHNLLRFLKLRLDPHSQFEIREYARVIQTIARVWVPVAMEAADDYLFNAVTFSAKELAILRELLSDSATQVWDIFSSRPHGLSDREVAEFERKLWPGA